MNGKSLSKILNSSIMNGKSMVEMEDLIKSGQQSSRPHINH